MLTELELVGYLEEVRRDVRRCPERPTGGPPCAPLGKMCGVEMHLAKMVDAIRGVYSGLLAPYQDALHREVCAHCSQRGGEGCPCPMDTLAALVVEAVEDADEGREQWERLHRRLAHCLTSQRPAITEMHRVYEERTGSRIGCD